MRWMTRVLFMTASTFFILTTRHGTTKQATNKGAELSSIQTRAKCLCTRSRSRQLTRRAGRSLQGKDPTSLRIRPSTSPRQGIPAYP
jgi:hypothetical protein